MSKPVYLATTNKEAIDLNTFSSNQFWKVVQGGVGDGQDIDLLKKELERELTKEN